MAVVVVDGTNPGSRVKSVDNAAIIAQVVCNPDGTTIGSSADPVVFTPVQVTSTTGSNVSVTATSGTALAANTARKSVTIVNYGANPVTLSEGSPAVFGAGIYLNAGGGTYNMGADYLYTGIITAICASTLSSTLAVVERQ